MEVCLIKINNYKMEFTEEQLREQIKELEENLSHGQENLTPLQIISNREMRIELTNLKKQLIERSKGTNEN